MLRMQLLASIKFKNIISLILVRIYIFGDIEVGTIFKYFNYLKMFYYISFISFIINRTESFNSQVFVLHLLKIILI